MEINLTEELWNTLNPYNKGTGIQNGAIWKPFNDREVEFYVCYLNGKKCFVLHHDQGTGAALVVHPELKTAGTLLVGEHCIYISHEENKSLIWARNVRII